MSADNLLRRDTSLEALAALPPAFDKRYGSVTAGNSSALTDGAAAVLLMAEEKARGRGPRAARLHPLVGRGGRRPGRAAADGPGARRPEGARARRRRALGHRPHRDARGVRRPGGLEHPGARVRDAGPARSSAASKPVGKVDRDRLNVCGGSIALGHPFGATGARLVTTLANEMKRRGAKLGLVSVCAQGGMGFAMVLER